MKKKIIYTIFFIILSLILITLNNPNINSISDLKSFLPAKGTFEELVLNNYFDKSTGDEFDDMYMIKYTGKGYTGRNCKDIDLLYETLDQLCKIELRRYYKKIDLPSENEYHIHIDASKTGEGMEIFLLKDYIIVHTFVLDTKKDNEKNTSHPDTDFNSYSYKITDNNLEDGYLEELFNSLDEHN